MKEELKEDIVTYIFLLLFLVIILFFANSCTNMRTPFKGYVVGREYVAEHMCCDNEDTYEHVCEATVIVPHVQPHVVHHHTRQEATYTLWIANKYAVHQVRVSKELYELHPMLSKISVYE